MMSVLSLKRNPRTIGKVTYRTLSYCNREVSQELQCLSKVTGEPCIQHLLKEQVHKLQKLKELSEEKYIRHSVIKKNLYTTNWKTKFQNQSQKLTKKQTRKKTKFPSISPKLSENDNFSQPSTQPKITKLRKPIENNEL